MEKMIIIIALLIFPFNVLAFEKSVNYLKPPPNPSAAYCEGLGYEFIIKETEEGEIGICKFSENMQVPAWEFLRGEDGLEYSYCHQASYEMRVIDNPEKCGFAYKPGHGCLACVLKDGMEVEVGNLMKMEKEAALSVESNNNKVCQKDGKCLGKENSKNCPEDCVLPQSDFSEYLKYFFWAALILMLVIAIIVLVKVRADRKNFNKDNF